MFYVKIFMVIIMLDKSIFEICELLETKDSISYKEFNELYLRFYSSLIGTLKSHKYQDKKETLSLAYILININVLTQKKKEENDINLKKDDIIKAINNLQNNSKRR